jgi:hypothetical protein
VVLEAMKWVCGYCAGEVEVACERECEPRLKGIDVW